MRSATPSKRNRTAFGGPERELPLEPVLEPPLDNVDRPRSLEAEDDIDDADRDGGAEQARAFERRVGLGKVRQQRFCGFGKDCPCVIQPVGRNRAAAAPIPRLEEALKDFVDEASSRAR